VLYVSFCDYTNSAALPFRKMWRRQQNLPLGKDKSDRNKQAITEQAMTVI